MTEKEKEVAALIDASWRSMSLLFVRRQDPPKITVQFGIALRADFYPFAHVLRLTLPEDWKETVYDADIAFPDRDHMTLKATPIQPPRGADAAWRCALWNSTAVSGSPDERYLVRFAGDLHYGSVSAEDLVRMVCEAMAADMNGELPF